MDGHHARHHASLRLDLLDVGSQDLVASGNLLLLQNSVWRLEHTYLCSSYVLKYFIKYFIVARCIKPK